jgi:hypothetical protein
MPETSPPREISGVRTGPIRSALLGLVVAASFWLGWVALTVRLPLSPPGSPAEGEWVGATHVHSDASDDASTPLPEIGRIAAGAGLDFVLITDHNSGGSGAVVESGVLMALAEEASTDAGHLLVMGAGDDWRDRDDPSSGEWANIVAAARRGGATGLVRPGGGLVFLAHPEGPNEWRAPELRQVDGMEVWNADLDWRAGDGVVDWAYALASLISYPIGAMAHLLDRPDGGLARLDDLLSERSVAATCALDVHQNIEIVEHRRGIPFPTFGQMFSMARQHVQVGRPRSGDPEEDALALWEALAAGRSYCAFHVLADGSGLVATAVSGEARASLGGILPLGGEAWLELTLPPAGPLARTTLFRDGQAVASTDGAQPFFRLGGPGVYRIEVSLPAPGLRSGRKPWILTNPIYVVPAGVPEEGRP